jgi:CRISPR/Cas system-associated protein Cas10 (large subunit of type III CRISPR-Cas system)
LFSVNDPLSDEWLIIEISNSKKNIIHRSIYRGILKDVDSDGIIEVGGCGTLEAACLYCDSVYYNPYRIYKLSNTLTFDSLNSKKITLESYGKFLGYSYLDTVVRYNPAE